MTHRVREATPDDVATITGLVNRAYLVERFFVAGPRTDDGEIATAVGRRGVLVAEREDGAIDGCVVCHLDDPASGEGSFGMLAVEPGAQRQGLGAQLVAAAEHWLREQGCTRAKVQVVSPRPHLTGWYRRFGYEETGTEPWPEHKRKRLRQPAHFIVMHRRLTSEMSGG